MHCNLSAKHQICMRQTGAQKPKIHNKKCGKLQAQPSTMEIVTTECSNKGYKG